MEELTMREILSGHEHTRERGTGMTVIAEYPHLKFSAVDHFRKALQLAESLGDKALESFKSNFASLERICARQNETGEVHPDFVEGSFYFRLYREDGSLSMDGGIILHGTGNRTFSVELCPREDQYWSMHT